MKAINEASGLKTKDEEKDKKAEKNDKAEKKDEAKTDQENDKKTDEKIDNKAGILFCGPREDSKEIRKKPDDSKDFETAISAACGYYMQNDLKEILYFSLLITPMPGYSMPLIFLKKIYGDAVKKEPLKTRLSINNVSYVSNDNKFYVFYTAPNEKKGREASQLLRSITDIQSSKR